MRNLYFGDLYKKCTSSSSTKNHNAHKNDVVSVLTTKVQIETFFGLQDLAFDTLQGWNGIKYQYSNILYWLSLVIHF